MIAFFWNLSFGEVAVVLILAVLIFGKRLPEVAGEAFRTVSKLRRHFEDLRRESGIDREIFDVKRTFQSAAREAQAEPVSRRPPARDQAAWSTDRREEIADAAPERTDVASGPPEPASPERKEPERPDTDR